jgi:hypothetical protein
VQSLRLAFYKSHYIGSTQTHKTDLPVSEAILKKSAYEWYAVGDRRSGQGALVAQVPPEVQRTMLN